MRKLSFYGFTALVFAPTFVVFRAAWLEYKVGNASLVAAWVVLGTVNLILMWGSKVEKINHEN